MTINYKTHFSHTSLHFFAYPTRALLWTHFGAPNTSLPDFQLNLTGLSIEKLTPFMGFWDIFPLRESRSAFRIIIYYLRLNLLPT